MLKKSIAVLIGLLLVVFVFIVIDPFVFNSIAAFILTSVSITYLVGFLMWAHGKVPE